MEGNTDIVLTNVSELLQQLGHQIDAHEQQVQQKTETQYQRNEQLVTNTINNLFTSVLILIRETVRYSAFKILRKTSLQLLQLFELTGNVTLVANAQEQEEKQNQVTAQMLKNAQKAWQQATDNTHPPEVSVETLLMDQAQARFKQLDCHRRVLVVALQTYQTNQLQQEIQFMESIYSIKCRVLKALWERLQTVIEEYQTTCTSLVKAVGQHVTRVKDAHTHQKKELQDAVTAFQQRFTTLWTAYKKDTQTVDDTSTAANDLRVAIDTLLAQGGLATQTANHLTANHLTQAVTLLKKHWTTVAKHIEDCPLDVFSPSPKAGTVPPVLSTLSKPPSLKATLQKKADQILFCAKNRAKVLQSAKKYSSTSEWIAALQKWDRCMKQLELEVQHLRRAAVQNMGRNAHKQQSQVHAVECEVVSAHRQWKRLVFALEPLAASILKQEQEIQSQESTMFAVLLNKVGYELKQNLEKMLQSATDVEEEHMTVERAQVEAKQEDFKVVMDKFATESKYMETELQGYGPVSSRCLELLTKLYKLKTWQEHASHLKQQLLVLQPLVVHVSQVIKKP